MAILSIEKASLAFGHHPLLDEVSFSLEQGDKVGLIGRNGAGKSSLLKAVAGTVHLDDGRIVFQDNIKTAWVPQEPEFDLNHTVFEAVAEGLGELKSLLTEYHQLTKLLHDPQQDHDALLEKLHHLQHELEIRQGWQFENMIENTLQRLGLNADALISSLSGGWKKRVALARALVSNPDLLLLDEPTNHLDVNAIEWLEELLAQFKGTLLFITHDRTFLDHVANRIVELDRGFIRNYPGNFAAYQQRKAQELTVESIHNRKFDKFWKQEEVWIRKGIEARRTRNEGRVRRLEELRRQRAARRELQGRVNLSVSISEKSSQLIAELEQVSKSFGDKKLIDRFSTRIMRGDKIGLVGPNGAGKTTLLKLILGEIQPDSGTIKQGARQEIAYFDQFRTQLDEDATLIDVISQGSEFIDLPTGRKHVMSYLEDFLFPPARARSPVRSLSGGERNRLLLARLFTKPANILVLDEPTNDLDIDTLDLLEQLLSDYQGTLFLVSHDRAFLDNVVTQVIAFEGEGKLIESPGGWSDWQNLKKNLNLTVPPAKKTPEATVKTEKTERVKERKNKLTYNENKELTQLPEEISQLEAEQAELQNRLLDPNVYRQQIEQVKQWQQRIDEIDLLLMEKLERWEWLENKRSLSQ